MHDDEDTFDNAIALLLTIPVIAVLCWMTVISFTGGTMPILGTTVEGGIVNGTIWVVFVDPVLMGVAYIAIGIISGLLGLAASVFRGGTAAERPRTTQTPGHDVDRPPPPSG